MDKWIITADGSECVVHAGILGMKWGRRRYQNKDGSLTPEGRLRYGSKDDRDSDANDKADQRYNSRQLRKNMKNMSDKELQEALNRKRNEQQLRQMLDDEISPGRKRANEILSSIGTEVAKEVGKKATLAAMDMALKKFTAGNITASEFVRAMKITDFKASVFDDNESSGPKLTGKKKPNDSDNQNNQSKQEKKSEDSNTQSNQKKTDTGQNHQSAAEKAIEEAKATRIKNEAAAVENAKDAVRTATAAADKAANEYKNYTGDDAKKRAELRDAAALAIREESSAKKRLQEMTN